MRTLATIGVAFALLGSLTGQLHAQSERDNKVLNDRQKFQNSDHWIYNDLPAAQQLAREQTKPLFVVFRCIPCEACHEFDEQVAARDPIVRDLMDQFVCVRIPQANGMDLMRFQFDFDQSFAALLMHPDGTLLGRFGTRSNRDEEARDISLDGLKQALEAGLDIYRQYPLVKTSLQGKQVQEARFATPEEYPHLRGRYTGRLDYEANSVAASCIHCHQIGEAERSFFRDAAKPIPDPVLFPYPNPRTLGLDMDPKSAATVQDVPAGSIASRDGFQPGDRIISFDGQPPISTADLQWVLHHAPAVGSIPVQIEREGARLNLTLTLPKGWRHLSDLSWRATTWELRRRAFGGMLLGPLTSDQLQEKGLATNQMALLVKHVGQFGEHALAKKAGVIAGDIIVGYDGQTTPATETQLIAHAVQNRKPGDPIEIILLRDGKRQTITIKLP